MKELSRALFEDFKKYCFKKFKSEISTLNNFKQRVIPYPIINKWFATYYHAPKELARAMIKEWKKMGWIETVGRKGVVLRK